MSELDRLLAALHEQTLAMDRLANSNLQLCAVVADLLAQVMADAGLDEFGDPTHYLDGSRVKG